MSFATQVELIHERRAFVPTWTPQHEGDVELWEWQDGERVPFVVNGQRVRISMIPPERRWAVRANGEIPSQNDFKQLHERYYIEYFGLDPNGMPDDPSCRYIPNVRAFLSQRVHPEQPEHLIEIGYDPHKPAQSTKVVRPEGFQAVDPDELGPGYQLAPQPDADKDAEIARLRAEVEAQAEKAEARESVPPPKPPRPEKPLKAATCGKEVKNVKSHERWCRACGGTPPKSKKG